MQDVKRDYLITLRNSEISLKVEEMRAQEDKVEEPLLIKPPSPQKLNLQIMELKRFFLDGRKKMMGFLIVGFQINLM